MEALLSSPLFSILTLVWLVAVLVVSYLWTNVYIVNGICGTTPFQRMTRQIVDIGGMTVTSGIGVLAVNYMIPSESGIVFCTGVIVSTLAGLIAAAWFGLGIWMGVRASKHLKQRDLNING